MTGDEAARITAADGAAAGGRVDPCPGCGAELWPGDTEVVVPEGFTASAGCWAAYRRLVAEEYRDPTRWAVRELTSTAYGLQHPGSGSRAAAQAIGVHLVTLHFVLVRGFEPEVAPKVRRAAEERLVEGIQPLRLPANLRQALNVRHAADDEAGAYRDRVRAWAASVWERWAEHHDTVERWADWLVAASPPGFPHGSPGRPRQD
jgi:hypothetical protein